MNETRDPIQAAKDRAAALARAIAAAAESAPSRLPAPLHALIEARTPENLGAALQAIESEELSEEALDWVRAHRREDRELRAKLEPSAEKSRARRAGRIHLDSHRALIRARYAKGDAVSAFGHAELQSLFTETLRLEGLRLELDLSKRPRPLVTCAPPLPPGVTSDCEWLEAQLLRLPKDDAGDLVDRLNARLPTGLALLEWRDLPAWSTPVAELCTVAHWSWRSDDPDAERRTEAFLAASEVFLEKAGKVEGQKQDKRLNLRPVFLAMHWEGDILRFSTALGVTSALNPLKALGAILNRAPESISGLRRLGFDMIEDPRLAKGDRYQAKLKNMYEDAVLLGAGSNITIVEDDDDEPLTLG